MDHPVLDEVALSESSKSEGRGKQRHEQEWRLEAVKKQQHLFREVRWETWVPDA